MIQTPQGQSCCRYQRSSQLPLTSDGARQRSGLLISLDGALGEAAPLPGLHRESLDEVQFALAGFVLPTLGAQNNAWSLLKELAEVRGFAALPPSLRFGIESACLQRVAAQRNEPVGRLIWGEENRETPPAVGLFSGTSAQAEIALGAGHFEHTSGVKIKVGRHDLGEDRRTIEAFRHALPAGEIRLDANRSLDLAAMRELSTAVRDLEVRFVEEPFAKTTDLEAYLEETKGLPIALDESFVEAVSQGKEPPSGPKVAAWVIKPSCLGLLPTAQWIRRAEGVDVIISSSFESEIGLSMLMSLAAGCSASPGLGTARWFDRALGATDLEEWFPWPEVHRD